jgi:hypothetical protein
MPEATCIPPLTLIPPQYYHSSMQWNDGLATQRGKHIKEVCAACMSIFCPLRHPTHSVVVGEVSKIPVRAGVGGRALCNKRHSAQAQAGLRCVTSQGSVFTGGSTTRPMPTFHPPNNQFMQHSNPPRQTAPLLTPSMMAAGGTRDDRGSQYAPLIQVPIPHSATLGPPASSAVFNAT